MKIAFDVDDVITDFPDFYAAITESLMKNGHEVYIITDFDEYFRRQREKELERYGILYTELIITSEKEQYCKEHDISFSIDDDSSYFPNSKKSAINLFQI